MDKDELKNIINKNLANLNVTVKNINERDDGSFSISFNLPQKLVNYTDIEKSLIRKIPGYIVLHPVGAVKKTIYVIPESIKNEYKSFKTAVTKVQFDTKSSLIEKIDKVIGAIEKVQGFSTPVEDRSYRDALDAIEKAKTESDTSTFPHTPEKYQDYENAKDIADKNKRLYKLSKLDKNKQKPVPGSNIYVGSIFNTSIYLSPFGDKGMRLESNQCKLRIGNSKDSFEINTDGLKDGRLSPNERNRINNSNKAISDLKKYQKPMTVNSRKDFIKLAKEIADKLHEYNRQGL